MPASPRHGLVANLSRPSRKMRPLSYALLSQLFTKTKPIGNLAAGHCSGPLLVKARLDKRNEGFKRELRPLVRNLARGLIGSFPR